MRNRTSSKSRAVDGRSLRAGKLLAGLQASQSEQRKSGDRRHESRRALGLPEAALALYTGAAGAWDLPTTTVKRHLVCKRWTREKADENSNDTPWFALHRSNSDK